MSNGPIIAVPSIAIPLQVRVTPEDIRVGKPGACRACPVARAINRAVQAALGVSASATVGEVIRVRDFPAIAASPEVVAWAHAFDRGEPVGPFGFELVVDGGGGGERDGVSKSG